MPQNQHQQVTSTITGLQVSQAWRLAIPTTTNTKLSQPLHRVFQVGCLFEVQLWTVMFTPSNPPKEAKMSQSCHKW